ncbi:hypothetical protein KKH26_02140, partial [Patescibacteria group bacterium]|nr:hypothetical protein [Patescibacteria group bacterium]
DYKINTVTTLAGIQIIKHFDTDNFSFTYSYNTENGKLVRIRYLISDYWIDFKDGDLSVPINNKVSDMTKLEDSTANMKVPIQKKLKQYATIFYQKTEKYFKKTSGIILGDAIITKVIRMTADNLNQKEQIVFNKSALLSCELDDLLR